MEITYDFDLRLEVGRVVLGSDGIHNVLVYSIIQYYITIVITCIQYNYK